MRAGVLCVGWIWLAMLGSASAEVHYPPVVREFSMQFPRDEGSHPEFRSEWWYLTGWLDTDDGKELGFQVTFFRLRPGHDEANPSRFAAKQVLFAHASLSDPSRGRLLRDEKSARAGFGLAEAREGSLDVRIDAWSLTRNDSALQAVVVADEFRFALELTSPQPPLRQGFDGYSPKSLTSDAASYYYSLPHLSVVGTVGVAAKTHTVRGVAWLDHEWFNSIMDRSALGWDWIGLNMNDGSALMVARMRTLDASAHWTTAAWRDERMQVRQFLPRQIAWRPLRRWKSPRTGSEYPVEWRVDVGGRALTLRPLFDDQENDARGSTGTIYWEGAVRAYDETGRAIGKGYLELTGYGNRARF